MNKNKTILPIMGQPIWVITENPLEDLLEITKRGTIGTLTYFAADPIQVMAMEYENSDMKVLVLNKDMVGKNEKDEEINLEIRMDLLHNTDEGPVFIDERIAQDKCATMNKNQKRKSKEILDLATVAYNRYDNIIDLCKVPIK